MQSEHEQFMEMALEEARKGQAKGNMAVGSVIVKDGQVIARGHNLTTSDMDVTAHAETVALRNAGPALGHLDLSGCTLYTTFELCMMCAGAIVFSGVSTLVMGGNFSPTIHRLDGYTVEKAFALAQREDIQVIRGVLVEACEEILGR